MPHRYRSWILVALATLLLGAAPAHAQTELVKDINPGAGYDSTPEEPVDLGGRLFFTAQDETHGFEPWVSDGTAAGTQLVKEIEAGTNGFGPEATVALNGRAFFSAQKDDTSYRELWVSDGTPGGTYQVKEINTSGGSNPDFLVAFDGRVFFQAEGDQGGMELWVSDGTAAGTYLFKDLYPGTYQQYGQTYDHDGDPGPFVVAGANLFFPARNGGDEELWVSDGTPGGTRQVADLYPGGNGGARSLTPFGDHVVFGARDANGDNAIWVSDGTEPGTVRLASSSFSPDIAVYDGNIYFEEGDALWVSDGTPGGTSVLVPDVLAENGGPLAACGGLLFLEGVNSVSTGTNLWVTDGTAGGTKRISSIADPKYPTCFHDRLYVSGNDRTTYGRELFVSDGTAEGTVLVRDISPGSDGSTPEPNDQPRFVTSGGFLYFAAEDPDHGVELWRSDGNPVRRASLDPASLSPIDWVGLDLEVLFNSLSVPVTLDAARDLTPPDASTLSLPDPQGLAVDALWTLTLSDNTATFDADVCVGIDALVVPGLSPADLRLYKRPDASSTAWTELTTELRPAGSPTQICATGVTGFSQFAVTAREGALPVEWAGMQAQLDGERVRLSWTTAAETNNAGFYVERRAEGGWVDLGYVEGHGTTQAPRDYRFADARVPFAADSLVYRLRQVDVDGTATRSDDVVVHLNAPPRMALHALFPNPAPRTATLRYVLPEPMDVEIAVYNVLGQRVATLATGPRPAGRFERVVDTRRWPSGLYFVRLMAAGQTQTRRLAVVR